MGETIWVSAGVYRQMAALAADKYPKETGGLLIGYESDEGVPVITAIVGSGPKARHARRSFIPDTDYQQTVLETHHLSTAGAESYLGDWHTHPDGEIALSRRDRKTLRNIAAAPDAYLGRPIMVILAPGRENWEIGAFRLDGWVVRVIFHFHDVTTMNPRIFASP